MSVAVRGSILRRLALLKALDGNPVGQMLEMEMCRRDPVRFFNNWLWTYDPRNAARGDIAHMPFDLFPKQEDMVRWLHERVAMTEEGLGEKSRDVGWTYVAAGYALHAFLLRTGFKTTFGSRKEAYVDTLGDPDSIFEKIRLMYRRLPPWFLPVKGIDDGFCKIVNRNDGNAIVGEAGDNMGRGGRSTLYIVDEGAFVERAERVDSAISANADCRIWASSVNGSGNLFFRKRHGGAGLVPLRPEQVFRFHWSDDPRKTAEWAKRRKGEMETWAWASEYDIDYSASVEGICVPSAWVESSMELHRRGVAKPLGVGIGGLDVGAGKAKSVYVSRFGPVVGKPTSWTDPDTVDTALRARDHALKEGCGKLFYDSVGVGHGVGSVLSKNDLRGIRVKGVNVGVPAADWVVWPERNSDGTQVTSEQKFANLKAEGWWTTREMLKSAHELRLFLDGEEGGIEHPVSDILVLPPDATEMTSQLSLPKWFRNERGKIIIEGKADMAKRGIPSPDYADALVLTVVPVKDPGAAWAAIGARSRAPGPIPRGVQA